MRTGIVMVCLLGPLATSSLLDQIDYGKIPLPVVLLIILIVVFLIVAVGLLRHRITRNKSKIPRAD